MIIYRNNKLIITANLVRHQSWALPHEMKRNYHINRILDTHRTWTTWNLHRPSLLYQM